MPAVGGVAVNGALTASAPLLLQRLVIMSGGAVTSRAAQFLEKTRPRGPSKPIELERMLALAGEIELH